MPKSRKGPGVSNFLSPRGRVQCPISPQLQEISTRLHITPTTEAGHETPHHSNCRFLAQFPTSPQFQGVGMVPHIAPDAGNQAQCPTSRDQTPCSTAPQGSLFQVHSTHLMSPEKLPLHPEGLTSQLRLPLAGPKLAAGFLLTFRISSAPWKGLPR